MHNLLFLILPMVVNSICMSEMIVNSANELQYAMNCNQVGTTNSIFLANNITTNSSFILSQSSFPLSIFGSGKYEVTTSSFVDLFKLASCSVSFHSIFLNISGSLHGITATISNISISDVHFYGNFILKNDNLPEYFSCLMLSRSILFSTSSSFVNCNGQYGGAIYMIDTISKISMTNFIGCKAKVSGGCIYASNSELALTSSSLLNAKSEYGGCINIFSKSNLTCSSCKLRHCESHDGGALYIDGLSSATFISSILTNNSATESGGAIYSKSGEIYLKETKFGYNNGTEGGALSFEHFLEPRIENSEFYNNLAYHGGAIFANGENIAIHIKESLFSNNKAVYYGGAIYVLGFFYSKNNSYVHNSAVYGGAVYTATQSTMHAYNDTYIYNFAQREGGSIDSVDNSHVEIEFCNFSHSSAISGAAISIAWETSLFLSSSFISGNQASNQGGGITSIESTIFIRNSTFLNNTAQSEGGALAAIGSNISLSSSSLNSNIAQFGGGIYASYRSVIFTDYSNISHNMAYYGGGMYLTNALSRISSCIFFSNKASSSLVLKSIQNLGISIDGTVSSYITGLGGAFYLYFAELSIEMSSIFKNNMADTGGVFYIEYSRIDSLNIAQSIFYRNTAYKNGGVYAILAPSIVNINGDLLFDNVALNRGSEFYGYYFGSVNLDLCMMKNGTYTGDSITDVGYFIHGNLNIRDSTFAYPTRNYFNQSAISTPGFNVAFSSLTIKNSEFVGFHAVSGAALSLTGMHKIQIENCSFLNNTSVDNGGALFVQSSENSTLISITGCTFKYNQAKLGGAIYSVSNNITIYKNIFRHNNATTGGGALYWTNMGARSIIEPYQITFNDYLHNYAAYGSNMATPAVYLSVMNNSILTGITSGSLIKNPIYVGLYDYYNNLVIGISPSVNMYNKSNIVSITGDTTNDVNRLTGIVIFSQLVIFYKPNATVTIKFSTSFPLHVNEATVDIHLRDCVPGEQIVDGVVSGQVLCSKCSPGTYSFSPETKCAPCLDNSRCYGGNVVDVNPGYWRQCDTCSIIIECPAKDIACLGGNYTATQCEVGYEGPKCSVCSTNYVSRSNYICNSCESNSTQAVQAVLIIFFIILFSMAVLCWLKRNWIIDKISIWIEKFHEKAEKYNLSKVTSKLKIMVSFVQILTTMPNGLNIVFPTSFFSFLNVLSVFNLSFFNIFSVGCVIPYNFYTELLLMTITPFVCVIIFEGVISVRHLIAVRMNSSAPDYTYKDRNNDRTYFLLLVSFVFFCPTSIMLFETFACEKYENGEFYLSVDSSLNCNSTAHQFFTIYSSLMIIIYPLGIPLFYLYHLSRKRLLINPPHGEVVRADELNRVNPILIQKAKIELRKTYDRISDISFLFDSFYPKYWYFEIIECGRRLALTALPVLFLRGTVMQVVISLLIALAFAALSMRVQPFINNSDNEVYVVSNWAVVLTLIGGLCVKVNVSDSSGNQGGIGIILTLLNVITILFTFYASAFDKDFVVDMDRESQANIETSSTVSTTVSPISNGNKQDKDSDDDDDESVKSEAAKQKSNKSKLVKKAQSIQLTAPKYKHGRNYNRDDSECSHRESSVVEFKFNNDEFKN